MRKSSQAPEMTNNQLQDIILKLYLQNRQGALEGNPLHTKVTFAKIVKSQEPKIEEWRIAFLKDQLFADNFLENAKYGDNEPFSLTSAGIKAAQNGHYVPNESNRLLDNQTKIENLKSLKRSKGALTIAILALIISTLVSLYSLWNSNDSVPTQDFKQLQERVNKLDSLKMNEKNNFKPSF